MPPQRHPAPRSVRLILSAAAVVIAGFAAFLVTVNRTSLAINQPAATAPAARTVTAPSQTPSLDDIALAALSRTVTVESLRASDEGLGTGWLLDTRGDFVTNAHVVDQQETVRLRGRDGASHVGTVLAIDHALDIAIVRSSDGFAGTPLPVRSEAIVRFPTSVVAIASGQATGHEDITAEQATRLAADVPVTGDTGPGAGTGATTDYHDMLVLDGTTIYPGNSGGPVLDGSGEVVGIVTLASRSAPEGYAIPISRVIAELLGDAAR